MIRKCGALAILILSLVLTKNVCWGSDYDFRQTRWGMSHNEVLASEEIEPVEKSDNLIRYNTEVLGKNVDLLYSFVDDKLIGASYRLNDNYLVSDHFIRTYSEFQKALREKYGQPKEDNITWVNNLYRNAESRRGLALSLGHVIYESAWETTNTTINCSLREQNYNVLCQVEYLSKEFNYLMKFAQQEKKTDPF
jgi:hypothetical protein